MDTLLYFLFWGAFIFLMMRLGCGAHVMGGHRHGKPQSEQRSGDTATDAIRWIAPETDTDPVCGKTVRTDGAKPSVHDGTVYYFCSRECREAFEAAPATYAGNEAVSGGRELEHSHV